MVPNFNVSGQPMTSEVRSKTRGGPPEMATTLVRTLILTCSLLGVGGRFASPSGFSCAIAKRRKIESSYLVTFS